MKREQIYSLLRLSAVGMAAMTGLLAPRVGRAADVSLYKFTAPIAAKGDLDGAHQFQVGSLNINDQFTVNMVTDGERLYAWDGTKVVRISDSSIKLPDGTAFSTGNVWSPHGINDAGRIAWVADADSGDHVVVVYDLKTAAYTLIAKPGLPAPGGDVFINGGTTVGPSHRQSADINNLDQVVWNQLVNGADGQPHHAIFMDDLASKVTTAVVRPGTPAPGGQMFDHAWTPVINDKSQVAFTANTQGSTQYGIYVWDKGNYTAIAAPGTKVDNLTIDQAAYPRIAKNGDVVFVAEVGSGHDPLSEGTTADTAVFLYTASNQKLQTIVKPGDTLPGGLQFQGVEPNRRPVGVNSQDQIAILGIQSDNNGIVLLWQNGKLETLARYGDPIPGLGKVTGLGKTTTDASGNTWDGYHLAINENGDVVFSAQIDGTGSFVLATAPKPAAPAAPVAPAAATPAAATPTGTGY